MVCIDCVKNSVNSGMFCPICGNKFRVEFFGGKRVLVCPRHSEMKVYLDQDPFVSAAVVERCENLGIGDLEAS